MKFGRVIQDCGKRLFRIGTQSVVNADDVGRRPEPTISYMPKLILWPFGDAGTLHHAQLTPGTPASRFD